MDPVRTQEPADSSLPDIHLDSPPPQHAVPTPVLILAGIVLSFAGAYFFLHGGLFIGQSITDSGTPTEEKAAAIASVKAAAEAEGRPKLTREEKMQFMGVMQSGEATSTEEVSSASEE